MGSRISTENSEIGVFPLISCKGNFREVLKGSEANSEKTVKKEANFEALQEVPPIATA